MPEAATQHLVVNSPHRNRAMTRADLMGSHTHRTSCEISVHVYQRNGKFLARGRVQQRMFGVNLGSDEREATARLRRLLTEIEDGSFVRPSESRKRPLANRPVPRLSLRQLVNEFLSDKRKLRGRKTALNYRVRLQPVLEFAELPDSRKRWPLAMNADHEFAVDLRTFLNQYQTTRNGRPGGTSKSLSHRQIVNVLVCLRTVFYWARRAEVHRLPAEWANPLSADIIGKPPAKDPLREDKLPLPARIRLVDAMDRWQFCHLTLSVVLPLRPEEVAGLLVSDVDFERGRFEIGTRLGGGDFTKGRTSFVLPFPNEVRPLLQACIGGRTDGPLLRKRTVFEGRRQAHAVISTAALMQAFELKLARSPVGTVLTEQDRKDVFRRLLLEYGGVSQDELAKECKALLSAQGFGAGVTLYTLRGSVTTAMARSGMPHLELRYLTGHTASDILNQYVNLDPVEAMGRYFDAIRPLLDAITQKAAVARRC